MANKKATLDFTVGLILSILMISLIGYGAYSIYSRGAGEKPINNAAEFVAKLNEMAQKPEGSSGTFLSYLGGNYAVIGFSSTADSVKSVLYGTKEEGSTKDLKTFQILLLAERPSICEYEKPCLCLVENPVISLNSPTGYPYTFLFSWNVENQKCFQNQLKFNEFANVNFRKDNSYLREPGRAQLFERKGPGEYFKGGFILTRNENLEIRSQVLEENIGFLNIPKDPQIVIEKLDSGIAVCFASPCLPDEIKKHQESFAESNKKLAEAKKAYESADYAKAQALCEEILSKENEENMFPGNRIEETILTGEIKLVGAENILNKNEYNQAHFLLAMSLAKQKKYKEALVSFRRAEKDSTIEETKRTAKAMADSFDCSKRSFALCNENDPKDACYMTVYPANSCNQCDKDIFCENIDNEDSCIDYPCNLDCVWDRGLCISAEETKSYLAEDWEGTEIAPQSTDPDIVMLSNIWESYKDAIIEASAMGVPKELILGLIGAETRGNLHSISITGAAGIGQFTHATNQITKIQSCCIKEEGETNPNYCAKERKRCGSSQWCAEGNYGCSPDPESELFDERFDARKSILSIAESELLPSFNRFSKLSASNELAVLAYNAGRSISISAVEATGKENPSWAEIQEQLTSELFAKYSPYNKWSKKRINNKIKGIKDYVPKLMGYKQEAVKIIGSSG